MGKRRGVAPRIPEGGAIGDECGVSAEEYGKLMFAKLKGEYLRFARDALQSARPNEGASVLEIGPGPGWAGILLLRERPDLRLTGIDASPDMVRAAAANARGMGVGERASYRVGTAETLEGVPDGSQDLIISRDSLHHWDDPGAAFASMLRVLSPGGAICLRDERRDISGCAWAFARIFGALTMGGMSRYWLSSIRAAYTPEELRQMLPVTKRRSWIVRGGFLDLELTSENRD